MYNNADVIKKPPTWAAGTASLAVDLITAAAFRFLSPWMARRFQLENPINSLIVLAAYFLMCGGVWIGRFLESDSSTARPVPHRPTSTTETGEILPESTAPKSTSAAPGPGFLAGLAWPYALFVIVMILVSGGAFRSEGPASSWLSKSVESPARGLIFLAGFLLVLLLFPLLVIRPSRPRIRARTLAHLLWKILAVGLINFMVLITAAFWESLLAGSEPMEIAWGGKLLIFAAAYPIFLMFYAPPRLAVLRLEPGRWASTGLFLFLAYTVVKYLI